MKTIKHETVLIADSKTELENKIVSLFAQGYQPTSDVSFNEKGKYQIDLKF